MNLVVRADRAALQAQPFERSVTDPIRRLRLALPHADLPIYNTISRDVRKALNLDLIHCLFANAQDNVGPEPFPHRVLPDLEKTTITGSGMDLATARLLDYETSGATLHFNRDEHPEYGITSKRTLSCIIGDVADLYLNVDKIAEMTRPAHRYSFHLHLTKYFFFAHSAKQLVADLPLPVHLRHLSVSFPPLSGDQRVYRMADTPPFNVAKSDRIIWIQQFLAALHSRTEGNIVVDLIGVWAKWNRDAQMGDHVDWDGLWRKTRMHVPTALSDDLYDPSNLCTLVDQGWFVAGKVLAKKKILVHHAEASNVRQAVDLYTRPPLAPTGKQKGHRSEQREEQGSTGGPDGPIELDGGEDPESLGESPESTRVVNDGSVFVTFRPLRPYQACPACGHLYSSVHPLSKYAAVPHDYTLVRPQGRAAQIYKFDPTAPQLSEF